MGAWIETESVQIMRSPVPVAPHVGAWIETSTGSYSGALGSVAPHVGAWIETQESVKKMKEVRSRTPRGCVD